MSMLSLKQPRLFALRKQGQPEIPPIEQLMLERGLPLPEQEFRFAPAWRDFRFDYAWPEQKIALEIEGGGFGRYIVIEQGHERRRGKSIPIRPGTGIRVGGRHHSGEGFEDDCVKYNRAGILGWLVVRVTTRMIDRGEAIDELLDAFRARGWQEGSDAGSGQ